MSKRNRNKFRNRETPRSESSTVSAAPVQAKVSGSEGAMAQHAAEYRIINRDLIRLIVLNGIMLIALFALYYVNRSSGIVEHIYHRIF